MFRIVVLTHRYLGIGVCVLVALWSLSAFVMMYVQFPDLGRKEYMAGLPALSLSQCCLLDAESLVSSPAIRDFAIESPADRPLLKLDTGGRIPRTFDLVTGNEILSVGEDVARYRAASYFRETGTGASAELISRIDRDQWTVAGYFDPLRPFYLFAANDALGSRIYISAVNGEPVQDSTRRERAWNRAGAVVHWIYPTILRQNTGVWTRVVILTTLLSLFLVVAGLYIGVRQFRRRRDGGLSPYRGIALWHHYAGLLFGALTLTWLLSGLFSMNPWGLMEADAGARERLAVRGMNIPKDDLASLLSVLPDAVLPAGTVRLRSAPFDGRLAVLAEAGDGSSTRLDGLALEPAPLPPDTWSRLPSLVSPGTGVLDAGWIERGDAYYYSHHDKLDFPVYRVVLDDDDRTRYYFETESAQLVRKVDASARAYRWWFSALHRGDFAGLGQQRPLWDLLMLTLLAGVSVGALTGLYLGFRRVFRRKTGPEPAQGA